jgi:signal transduction histidine kinase
LLNLLGNACKFTQRGAVTLTVDEHVEGGEVLLQFRVTDTGIGISADDLERIFMPFVQVDDSPTRRQGGTGLGLTLTREIVVLLGGTIAVDSTLGEGTTFTVAVPRRWSRSEPAPQRSESVSTRVTSPMTT